MCRAFTYCAFLTFCLLSVQSQIKRKLFNIAKASVNMANINAQEMQSIPITLPSLERQKEIVSALDIQFKALHSLRELKENSKDIIEREINALW